MNNNILDILFSSNNNYELVNNFNKLSSDVIEDFRTNILENNIDGTPYRGRPVIFRYKEINYIIFTNLIFDISKKYRIFKENIRYNNNLNIKGEYEKLNLADQIFEDITTEFRKIDYRIKEQENNLKRHIKTKDIVYKMYENNEDFNKEKNEYLDNIYTTKEKLEKLNQTYFTFKPFYM